MSIRLAELNDLNSIVKIYNQAIIKGHSTADTEVFTLEQKLPWFENHYINRAKYPIFVIEREDKVVAWGSISEYRPGRKALESTVEISYYVHNEYQGQGIGKQLLEYLIMFCKSAGFKNLIGILLSTNTPSIKLLNSFDFQQWGYMPDIAVVEGQLVSHVYMGLKI